MSRPSEQGKPTIASIHAAVSDIAALTSSRVEVLDVDARIELLKNAIAKHTALHLRCDSLHIHVFEERTGQLFLLTSLGKAYTRNTPLYANTHGNGIVGFVAAIGKSYLCEDARHEPLAKGSLSPARSVLAVPLIFLGDIVGTLAVERAEPCAFSDDDVHFLEILCREITLSLERLGLIFVSTEQASSEAVEAVHGALGLPIDEILNDAVYVLERYLGHEPEVVQRLQRILKNGRDLRQVVHEVGQTIVPAEAVPALPEMTKHAKLHLSRVLVVDSDDAVRNDMHALLERYGCSVETAHEGGEAVFMVRHAGEGVGYDVIVADIRLPDCSGYELFLKLKEIIDPVPLILMTAFGYDPGHSIVKARQAGLNAKAILYKPFRLNELLDVIDTMITLRYENP